MIFQGIRTSIALKPFIFVIFRRGSDPLSPLWIRAWGELRKFRRGWAVLATIFYLNIKVFHRGPYEPPSRSRLTHTVQIASGPMAFYGFNCFSFELRTSISKETQSHLQFSSGVGSGPTAPTPPPHLDSQMKILYISCGCKS